VQRILESEGGWSVPSGRKMPYQKAVAMEGESAHRPRARAVFAVVICAALFRTCSTSSPGHLPARLTSGAPPWCAARGCQRLSRSDPLDPFSET